MINHPNAAGVLVLGLGCENNNIDVFKEVLGCWDDRRVKFLNSQDCDEIEEGIRLINELKEYANTFKRKEIDISKLIIGLKCGGSDGYSGITANPLVGRLSDKLISMGGSCILTEVPEMFGAEHLLMERCESEDVFNKTNAVLKAENGQEEARITRWNKESVLAKVPETTYNFIIEDNGNFYLDSVSISK